MGWVKGLMGWVKGLWGRVGRPAILCAVATGLALLDLALALLFAIDLHVRLHYGKAFLDIVFWQQLTTTFIGALLALAVGLGLYILKQKASEEGTRLAAKAQALNLLQQLERDLERDTELLKALSDRATLEANKHNRLRTVFLDMACRRLFDLRGNSVLASQMTDALDFHTALNRLLDTYCQDYYGIGDRDLRSRFLGELRGLIPKFAKEYLETTSDLITKIDTEVKRIEQEGTQ
jgi:hypothetical protein